MHLNSLGTTRLVFVFKKFVVKIPNFTYCFLHFLKGMVANINETQCWKYSKYTKSSELLCPVIYGCSLFLIMKKADVLSHIREVREMTNIGNINPEDELRERYGAWIEAGYGGDDKADNYGYYKGKLVKIDYGS